MFKVIKNDDIFSIFSRLAPYPQVFGKVNECLIVGLREIIRVPHVVTCPMCSNLLCDQGQQDGVLKPTAIYHFQVFLAV